MPMFNPSQIAAAAAASAAAAATSAAIAAAGGLLNYTSVVFGWNGTAGLDSARFGTFDEVGPGKLWVAYSPRNSSVNNGEIGMRLDVVELNYNDAAQTVTAGTPTTIATPAGFAGGTGAYWSIGLQVIKTGPNKGRKLVLVQELNSPDGTLTNAAARYDVALYYTDAITVAGPWTRVLLSAGATANTNFGLAAYNVNGAGLNLAGGQCFTRTAAGRFVVGGYLPGAPAGGFYLGSLYTDSVDGITGWTFGTPLAMQANDTEPSLALTSTGVAAFVRNESVNQRTIYTSPTGAVWTFARAATDVPIRNVQSCAARNSAGRIFVGGATTTGATGSDNRTGWKLFASDTDGVTFGAGFALFDPNQRIGYSCLHQLSDGTYGLMFEVSSNYGGSFNQRSTLGFARFNDATIQGVTAQNLPLVDGLRFNAAAEYSLYSTYVITTNGGTIQSPTATLAAITAAINGNYYSKIGFAVCGAWGSKNMGAGSPVLYGLNRTANTGATTPSFITLDTATFPGIPVVTFPGGTSMAFGGTVLRGGNAFGFVIKNKAAGGSLQLSWTNTVAQNINTIGQAVFDGSTVLLSGSPLYTVANTETANFHFDMLKLVAIVGKNGSNLQSVTFFPSYGAAGQTLTMTLGLSGGTNQQLAEAWHLNGVGLTAEMVRQCSADVQARS